VPAVVIEQPNNRLYLVIVVRVVHVQNWRVGEHDVRRKENADEAEVKHHDRDHDPGVVTLSPDCYRVSVKPAQKVPCSLESSSAKKPHCRTYDEAVPEQNQKVLG